MNYDDDLTAAYFAGYHAAEAQMRELRAQNAELVEVLDDIIALAEAGRMVHVINRARDAITKARGEAK